jgi:hypothetical protein
MGHLINPVSVRLGINRLWSYSWFSQNTYELNYIDLQEINLKNFIKNFFSLNGFHQQGFVFSHISYVTFSKYIDLKIFLYQTIAYKNFKIYKYLTLSGLLTRFFYRIMFFELIFKIKYFFKFYFNTFFFFII